MEKPLKTIRVRPRPCAALIGVMVLALAACGEMATLPISAGTGPQPTLPPPQQTLIPTVNQGLAW